MQESSVPELDFSVSHSADLILVAVVYGRRVGVDLEYVRTGRSMPSTLVRYYSRSEKDVLAEVSGTAKDPLALAYWVAKESVLKGLGVGLSAGLDAVSVAFAPNVVRLASRINDGSHWELLDISEPGFCAALAVEGTRPQLIRLALAPEQLQTQR